MIWKPEHDFKALYQFAIAGIFEAAVVSKIEIGKNRTIGVGLITKLDKEG